MAYHRTTDTTHMLFSVGQGEEHEIKIQVKYAYTPGSPSMWVKSVGTFDPPDPAELEIEELGIWDDKTQTFEPMPRTLFNILYDDDELKNMLEERAVDELNRGPDD